jgi:hypothetical protein
VPTWDQGVLRELFEIEVFRFLRKRELLSRERMELILSWPHSGFNVHVGETVVPDDKILRHVGFKHADTPPPRYHPPPQLCRSPLG